MKSRNFLIQMKCKLNIGRPPKCEVRILCWLFFYVFTSDIFLFFAISSDISKIKILVPGAGLGRLTYELAYRGFYCEGNEFSLFMLVASNFVLNRCITENQYTLYPWVHQFVNNSSRNDQVIAVSFPDVSPTKAKPKGDFNMVAGDFLQVGWGWIFSVQKKTSILKW